MASRYILPATEGRSIVASSLRPLHAPIPQAGTQYRLPLRPVRADSTKKIRKAALAWIETPMIQELPIVPEQERIFASLNVTQTFRISAHAL